MKLGLLLVLSLGLLASPLARASKLFSCHYFVYPSVPFVDATIGVSDDGTLDNYITASQYGAGTHRESAATMPCQAGELYHLVISREDPQNTIYMIIDRPKADGTYPSRLINPQMPASYQTIGGTCSLQ